MKALSIKQPWASLIANGIKDIENRSWRTKFRGRIFIHASAAKMKQPPGIYFDKAQWLEINHHALNHGFRFRECLNSAIIGEVDIVDCVINHSSIWAEQMITYKCEETGLNILQRNQPYVWNWVLENPLLYDQPILNVKGSLSFWNYEREYQVIGTAEMVDKSFYEKKIGPREQQNLDVFNKEGF